MPAPCDQVQHRNTACDSCTCPLDHCQYHCQYRAWLSTEDACLRAHRCVWAHRVPPALQHVRTRRVCRSAAPTESVRRCRLKSRRCAQYCTSRRIRQARLRFASLQRCKSRFPSEPGLLNRFRPAVGLSSSPWSSMRATSDSALLLRRCVHAAFHIAHFVDELVRRLVTADTLS